MLGFGRKEYSPAPEALTEEQRERVAEIVIQINDRVHRIVQLSKEENLTMQVVEKIGRLKKEIIQLMEESDAQVRLEIYCIWSSALRIVNPIRAVAFNTALYLARRSL